MISLDANFLIDGVETENPAGHAIATWLGDGETLICSSIAWAEFLNGPLLPGLDQEAREFLTGGVLAFDEEQALLAAKLFNLTGRRRALKFDCLIAAAAITSGARLATRNTEHFLPFVPYGLQFAI